MSLVSAARIDLPCRDAATAEAVRAALAPENDGFLTGRVEGSTLVLEARADDPMRLRRTLEDALACATAALRGLGALAPRADAPAEDAPDGKD